MITLIGSSFFTYPGDVASRIHGYLGCDFESLRFGSLFSLMVARVVFLRA
jgi:hypothetical protein